MKIILEKLFQHKLLSSDEARDILLDISTGKYMSEQIAAFLSAFIMRNISLQELTGFRSAMLELCTPVDLSSYDPMDLCGTGGDGKNTFNISTLAAFVVAGAGIPVAKHGNYGVSSISGSSNVLAALGIGFSTKEDELVRQMDTANICFLHAPYFHHALSQVAEVRKNLGVRTFFNMLGPLVNPARPRKQLVGVFSLELARMYQYLFQNTDMQFSIVHTLDGYDEITLTGGARWIHPQGEQILTADHFGMPRVTAEDLYGGDTVAEAAQIFMRVLTGHGSEAQKNVVLANASLAIQTYLPQTTREEAIDIATASLVEGKALATFQKLKSLF